MKKLFIIICIIVLSVCAIAFAGCDQINTTNPRAGEDILEEVAEEIKGAFEE